MDHRLSDELQQSKRSLKRSKSEAVRQKRPAKTSSHPQFENNSATINSNHSRKRPSSKSKITCPPGLVTASFDRDKFSSSSSYDRLPCGEVNSPGSGTESSCSAPSKLVENASSVLPERNLFENLEKDFAPSASKIRRVGNYNPSQNRPMSSLLNDHPQFYPSSPASPNIDQKEATYVPPNVHSSRKQVSIKTDNQDDHPADCVSSRQPPQQQTPNDSQYHGKMRSQFDSFPPTSFNNKQRNHHLHRLPQRCQNSPETNSVETVDLVSDDGSHESDYEISNFYIPTDKSISYHSAQANQYSLGRQQTLRSTSILRNGFKSAQDCTHLSKIDNTWDPPNLTSSSDFWNSRNYISGRESGGYYDNFESMRSSQADKRGSYAMHNQSLRNSSILEQTSKSMVLGQSQRQNDIEINLLKQCGCVEMGDIRCKNNIFCQALGEFPTTNSTITSAINIGGIKSTSLHFCIHYLICCSSKANPVPQCLSSGVSLNSSTRRVPISNGSVVGSSSRQQQQQQKPTIVHRLHNIPNLLQRTSAASSNTAVVWGQDGSLPSFIHSSASAQVSSLPPPSGFPPGSSSSSNSSTLTKVARKTPHIELSAGAPEVQVCRYL
uniref:Protein kinase domain-containing protein n=1 Tax=Rodentolepis nana TaxID=102285 RepID=A0A0R3T2D3_RODNA